MYQQSYSTSILILSLYQNGYHLLVVLYHLSM